MQKVLRRITNEVLVPDDTAYIELVQDILEHPVFQSMAEFVQHGATTTLSHCIAVSYLSYLTCEKYGLDARSAARAGLLHDMFLYDWHVPRPGKSFHGLTHPKVALSNAEKCFALNEKERDIILKHMWPLTLKLPRSAEAYVVLYHDKVCSTRESFGMPTL